MVYLLPATHFYAPGDAFTIPHTAPDAQAAARAAYIARVVAQAPPIPDDVLDCLAALLRPTTLGAAA